MSSTKSVPCDRSAGLERVIGSNRGWNFNERRLTMLRAVKAVVVLVSLLVIPTAVYAQASIVGTVKDTSGGVLPGVTVEASSPALIEKTRSAVTSGTGQYSLEDLRP